MLTVARDKLNLNCPTRVSVTLVRTREYEHFDFPSDLNVWITPSTGAYNTPISGSLFYALDLNATQPIHRVSYRRIKLGNGFAHKGS